MPKKNGINLNNSQEKIDFEKKLNYAKQHFNIVGAIRFDGKNTSEVIKFVEESKEDYVIETSKNKLTMEFAGGDISILNRGSVVLRQKSGQLLVLGFREWVCLFRGNDKIIISNKPKENNNDNDGSILGLGTAIDTAIYLDLLF